MELELEIVEARACALSVGAQAAEEKRSGEDEASHGLCAFLPGSGTAVRQVGLSERRWAGMREFRGEGLEADAELEQGHAGGGLEVRVVAGAVVELRSVDKMLFGLGVDEGVEVIAHGEDAVLLEAGGGGWDLAVDGTGVVGTWRS